MREFTKFEIEDQAEYGRVVEYRIRLRLRSIGEDAAEAEATIHVAYRLEKEDWTLVELSELEYRLLTP